MHRAYIENIKIIIFTKIPWLVPAILYGFFVVTMLQRHVMFNSGDIPSYLFFFNAFPDYLDSNEYSGFFHDHLFRNILFRLQRFYNEDFVVIFSYIGFALATIVFFICISEVRSRKHFIVILPLLLMIFFSPRVFDLFASHLRSGISFTALLISIHYLKGLGRYILMILSVLLHLSMLPIISFYFLFFILRNKRINASYVSSFFVLLLASLILVISVKVVYREIGDNMGSYYTIMVFLLLMTMILISKKAIKNVYGFMSIGLFFIILFGTFLDYDFRRYLGNSFVFYLLFALSNASNKTIGMVTLSFIPFFVLTNFYKFTNYI